MKKRKIIGIVLLVCLICSNFVVTFTTSNPVPGSLPPRIDLKAITIFDQCFPDYLNFLKQHLARLYINLEIELCLYADFYDRLINGHDFDIFCMEITDEKSDIDFSEFYSSYGFYNFMGYDPMMDYNDELGRGINDWYLKNGSSILPVDSNERREHYWDWQNYLQSDILPIKPLFSYEEMSVTWNNLHEFNASNGLLESWGKMWWEGLHENQNDASEIILADYQWIDLNPLFQYDPASKFITKACLDPLFWIEGYVHPIENDTAGLWSHLVESYEVINTTHLRLSLREGVQWQLDPDSLYSDEYFDVEDVYFTLYCWKYLSNEKESYYWLKEMEIIDNYTLDIFIDSNPLTPSCDPFSSVFSKLNVLILPEHYLNQTQEVDGLTPNISHSSWETFSSNCFGTGLFEIQDNTKDVETNLNIFANSWWLNESLTNDTELNFAERFGGFNHSLDKLCIRVLDIQIAYGEFNVGLVDIISISLLDYHKERFSGNSNFVNQNFTRNSLAIYGYNLRGNRAYIGDRTLSPIDPSITRGLALRKAISYASDKGEINAVIHRGRAQEVYWPIYSTMEEYCAPVIYRYHFDLDMARQFYYKADLQVPTSPTNQLEDWQKVAIALSCLVVTILVSGSTYIIVKYLKIKRKNKDVYQ